MLLLVMQQNKVRKEVEVDPFQLKTRTWNRPSPIGVVWPCILFKSEHTGDRNTKKHLGLNGTVTKATPKLPSLV